MMQGMNGCIEDRDVFEKVVPRMLVHSTQCAEGKQSNASPGAAKGERGEDNQGNEIGDNDFEEEIRG